MSAPTSRPLSVAPAAAVSAVAENLRETTAANILKQALSAGRNIGSKASSYAAGSATTFASGLTEERGSYWLSVLFYLLAYLFLVFIVAIFVHFTIKPVFNFSPGGKGIITIPTAGDDKVYWNDKTQPSVGARVPAEGDSIASYDFTNEFSFCIDILLKRLMETYQKKRLILFKTFRYGSDISGSLADPMATAPPSNTALEQFCADKCSMIMYLNENNDLIVTFFTGTSATPFSCAPIRNLPLYQPFRISVVVESRTFTVYLNGKQTFQKIVRDGISLNGAAPASANQRFYAAPAWAHNPTQSVFVQNFHLWPRAITFEEVQRAQPALATVPDFNAPADPEEKTCGV